MVNIDYIMELLDWNRSPEEQLLGVQLAQDVKCIGAFLQPAVPYGKSVWENCAKILSSRSDEELRAYYVELLEWLEDLNWPGALVVLDRLVKTKGALLVGAYTYVTKRALCQAEENEEWLDTLSKLLDNHELAILLNRQLYEQMIARYHGCA